MDKDTQELLSMIKRLPTSRELEKLMEDNTLQTASSLSQHLQEIMQAKALRKSEVVRCSGLDRTYAYQILQGTKQPSRDKLIALCVGMELNLEEAQKVLRTARLGTLYPKRKRDAVLIFALEHHIDIVRTNLLLDEFGECPL